jgi:predicted dehydrogenase
MDKLLVVGCGSIGRRHIVNFRAAGVNYIVGADRRQDRLDQVKAERIVDGVYQDYHEALDKEEFDAVVVGVPTSLHTKVALTAADKGCHLFIEKPLDASLEGLDRLKNLCREKHLVAFVAYCYRFIPSVLKMREVIASGQIGEILSARLEMSSYLPDWHPWEDYRSFYMSRKDLGGGALLDESHGIDLLRSLLGEIDSVSSFVDHVSHLELDCDDLAVMLLRFKSGLVASAHFDLLGRSPRVQLELIGSRGTILWDRIDHKLSVYLAESKKWEIYPYSPNDVLTMYPRETDHFITCVREGRKPLVDLEEGEKTLSILLAALESSKTGRVIQL